MNNKDKNKTVNNSNNDFNFDDVIVEIEGEIKGELKASPDSGENKNVDDSLGVKENNDDIEDVSDNDSDVNNDMDDISDDTENDSEIDDDNENLDADENEDSLEDSNEQQDNTPEENESSDTSKEGDSDSEGNKDNAGSNLNEDNESSNNSGESQNNENTDSNSENTDETNNKEDNSNKDNALENSNENKEKNENTPDENNNKKDKSENTPNKDNQNKSEKPNDNKPQKKDDNKNSKSPKSALDKKRDDLKNKWNNRPKNPKEMMDRAKNGIKNGIKNGAKNRFNNSRAGQAINKGKNAVEKGKKAVQNAKKAGEKTVKTIKKIANAIKTIAGIIAAIWPVLLVLIIAATLAFIIASAVPGKKGNVNDNLSNYSKTDAKTLSKIRKLFEKYPTADGTLAMITVIYPYYNNLWSSDVSLKISKDYSDEVDDKLIDEEDTDDKDSVEEEEDNTSSNDFYLELFRKYSYRNKLKKLLKELNKGDENAYYEYLKNEYFSNDKAYKSMIDNSSDKDGLKTAIIEDLKSKKKLFIDYVFENATCSSTLVDAGSVSTPDLITTGVVIDLKKPGCSNMSQCSESYYDSYLSLEEYVKGVVYEEISGVTDLGIIEAQMVAVKSFALSRRKAMKDDSTGAYVISMLWSTADQDFCHVEKGCNDSNIQNHYGYNNNGNNKLFHGANRPAASETQKALYNQAWEETKDIYMLDSNGNVAKTAYYAGSSCKIGSCMRQDSMEAMTGKNYSEILSSFYTLYSIATVSGNDATIKTVSNTICSNNTTNLTSTRNKIVSFASSYANKIPFVDSSLAKSPGYEENNFGITNDSLGNEIKTGLGNIGFINWVYWSTINNNFENTNDFQNIVNNSYEITQENLLLGDIGYSSDKTVFAIYAGDNKWIYEDSITGNVVIEPSDKFTGFLRLNEFKEEVYNFTIRKTNPKDDWKGNNMLWVRDERNVGQCVWYVRNRAMEILKELCDNGSLPENKCKTYKNRVINQYGDGKDFYPNGTASKGFVGSLSIDDIKSGTFIGLDSTSSPKHGHVGLIEYVSEDKQKIIYTDGYARGNCSKNDLSCVRFTYKEFNSFDEFKKYFNGGSQYTYKGYLYFLEN